MLGEDRARIVAVDVIDNEFGPKIERLHGAIVIQHRKVPLSLVHVSLQHKKERGRPRPHSLETIIVAVYLPFRYGCCGRGRPCTL